MTEWTVDELMVVALAAELTDDDRCVQGAASFIPVAAIGLAQRTHARGLIHLGGAVGVDARWETMEGSTVGPAYWSGASALLNHPTEFWPYVQSGRVSTIFHRAAQIDARGNLNNSMIEHPRPVRLPGGAAMADMGALAERVLLWSTTHDSRTFVERVDFVTCPGYLDHAGERERWGMRGGPVVVVTNLAVLDFSAEGRMRLRTVHPGVSVQTVLAQTGFELAVPDGDVATTPIPTEDQVAIVRALDPDGYRKREFRNGVPEVPRGSVGSEDGPRGGHQSRPPEPVR
jgi:glutaconate CoA-transferase, subunit B